MNVCFYCTWAQEEITFPPALPRTIEAQTGETLLQSVLTLMGVCFFVGLGGKSGSWLSESSEPLWYHLGGRRHALRNSSPEVADGKCGSRIGQTAKGSDVDVWGIGTHGSAIFKKKQNDKWDAHEVTRKEPNVSWLLGSCMRPCCMLNPKHGCNMQRKMNLSFKCFLYLAQVMVNKKPIILWSKQIWWKNENHRFMQIYSLQKRKREVATTLYFLLVCVLFLFEK